MSRPPSFVTRRRAALLSTAVAAATTLSIGSPRFAAMGATFGAAWGNFATGNYGTASNWGASNAPNDGVPTVNDYYNVTINRALGATVTGNMSPEILNLTIGASNALSMNASTSLDLIGTATNGAATLSNAGTLSLLTNAQLNLLGSSTTISGSGTVSMSSGSGIGGSGTVSTANTIRGIGALGENQLALVNTGLISADVSGVLTIDPRSSGGFVNNGTLRAENDGFLILSGNGGGSFNNAGGTMVALASSNLQLDAGAVVNGGNITVDGAGARLDLFLNSTVSGSTITTLNGGQVRVSGSHTGNFAGITLNGRLVLPSAATGVLSGTITNNGSIEVQGGSTNGTLSFGSGTTTLGGSGELVLSVTSGLVPQVVGTGTLVNNSTIRGIGAIGQAAGVIRNNGLIDGDGIILSPTTSGTGGFNTGTIHAGAGSTVQFLGGTWSNSGTIIADAGAGILLANATVNGGTISVGSAGSIQVQAGGSSIVGSRVVIGSGGTLDVPANRTLSFNALVNNAGNVNVTAFTSSANAQVSIPVGSLTLDSGGVMTLGTTSTGTASITGPGQLNNVNNLIHGRGFIGLNSAAVVNGGTIAADAGPGLELVIDPGAGGLTNTGTMLADNGGYLVLDGNGGGAFNNAGGTITTLTTSSRVVLRNGAAISGGTLSTVPNGFFEVAPGHTASALGVTNTGRISTDQGTLSFSGANHSQLVAENDGTLVLAGNVDNASGTVLTAGISGTAHFVLGGGTINLSGNGALAMGNLAGADADFGGSGTLVSGNQIRGAGLLGMNQIAIVNNDRIIADIAGRTLSVDPVPNGNVLNSGTLAATNGAILALSGSGGGFISNAGTVSAAGGTVLLQNGISISGGTIRTDPGSEVQVNGSTGGIAGVTNTGTIDVNNGTLTVNSVITNTGTISVVEDTNAATLSAIGVGATLNGGGQVVLGKASTGTPTVSGVGPLTNNNNTIRGRGFLGRDAIGLSNAGTIAADQSGQALIVDPAGASWTNSGTLTATGGGTLELSGAGVAQTLSNSAGRVIASTGSNVRMNDLSISGGTFSSTGTGSISVLAAHSGTLDAVTNVGNLVVENGGNLRVAMNGTLTNSGSVNVNGSSANTFFGAVSGQTGTLNGGGVVNLSGGSFAQVTGTLVNVNNTIRGSGHILDRYTNGITAILDADVPGQILQVTPAVQLAPSSVINNGLARARNGGTLEIATGGFGIGGSVFDNGATGTILAANGSMVHISGGSGVLGGVSISGGTILTSGSGTVLFENSVGLFNVNVAANAFLVGGGTLNTSGSVSTGTLTVIGTGTLGGATFTNAGLMTGGIVLDGQPGSASPAFVLNNTGTLVAVGTLGFIAHGGNTPPMLLNTGTVQITSGVTVGGQFGSSGNGTFSGANGTLIVDGGATFGFMNFPTQCGTLILNGRAINLAEMTANTITGTGTLLNTGITFLGESVHGTTTFQSSRVQNVEVADGTITTLANGGTLGTCRVTNLVIEPTKGHWNLNDNDLVVDYDVDSPLAQYRALLLSGRNAGAWNGPGLISASAAANPATGFGIMNAIDKFGSSGGVFSGQNVDATTLLIKYTWNGDANLDGRVTFDDYVKIDTGFNQHLPGYNNGDFNYDGVVNFDDYVLIDIAFNQQNGTLGRAIDWISGDDRSESGRTDFGELSRAATGVADVIEHFQQFGVPYAQHFLAAVPEPATTTSFVAVGACAAIRRRRRMP